MVSKKINQEIFHVLEWESMHDKGGRVGGQKKQVSHNAIELGKDWLNKKKTIKETKFAWGYNSSYIYVYTHTYVYIFLLIESL